MSRTRGATATCARGSGCRRTAHIGHRTRVASPIRQKEGEIAGSVGIDRGRPVPIAVQRAVGGAGFGVGGEPQNVHEAVKGVIAARIPGSPRGNQSGHGGGHTYAARAARESWARGTARGHHPAKRVPGRKRGLAVDILRPGHRGRHPRPGASARPSRPWDPSSCWPSPAVGHHGHASTGVV